MPGPGYVSTNGNNSSERVDFTPTSEELQKIQDLFNNEFDIPENFVANVRVFDPEQDNIKKLLF